ncbi:hypothetical protein [Amycolatopsis keratiniphila]|uniref:hypothetical protein n=1 Tax=Amycolatopsis keratiniphila TaxID=129921 RepID=UPI00087BF1FE|nr:hypothetical protein [Amycolatopsis keratiniphila]OLZ59576.1 hypothetical protein BS330_04075 [Amycolatopsis keratiniphila subsp. nogabecina]SDU53998.1 hypothetical protein SAMN04489733_5725 [Amycolatopsis keratiniphila]
MNDASRGVARRRPVHRALDVLAEREQLHLGGTDDYRIRREVVRELREQSLAELAADRTRTSPDP